MRIAREGIPLVLAGLVLTAVLWIAGWGGAALAALALSAFVAFFFRDPERDVPRQEAAILAPGDGKVIAVRDEGPERMVSIFLSLFDVHVNRAPISGVVQEVEHRPGRFLSAYKDAASRENERTRIVISGDRGTVTFMQVAGLVARRIVCHLRAGQTVSAGDRVGLIRFGSRVDVILPPTADPEVAVGDRVRGGLSVVARFRDRAGFPEEARKAAPEAGS
jgi:phosphatidylserine decarboxylase